MQPASTTPTLSADKTVGPSGGPLKAIAAVALAASIAWQLYAVALARWYAPRFRELFEGLGAPLPSITLLFLASYPYWFLVPLLFAVLALFAIRRQPPSVAYLGALLAMSFASALALHGWLQEAVYAPLYAILDKID